MLKLKLVTCSQYLIKKGTDLNLLYVWRLLYRIAFPSKEVLREGVKDVGAEHLVLLYLP